MNEKWFNSSVNEKSFLSHYSEIFKWIAQSLNILATTAATLRFSHNGCDCMRVTLPQQPPYFPNERNHWFNMATFFLQNILVLAVYIQAYGRHIAISVHRQCMCGKGEVAQPRRPLTHTHHLHFAMWAHHTRSLVRLPNSIIRLHTLTHNQLDWIAPLVCLMTSRTFCTFIRCVPLYEITSVFSLLTDCVLFVQINFSLRKNSK